MNFNKILSATGVTISEILEVAKPLIESSSDCWWANADRISFCPAKGELHHIGELVCEKLGLPLSVSRDLHDILFYFGYECRCEVDSVHDERWRLYDAQNERMDIVRQMMFN